MEILRNRFPWGDLWVSRLRGGTRLCPKAKRAFPARGTKRRNPSGFLECPGRHFRGKEPREIGPQHLGRKGEPHRRLGREGLEESRLHGRSQRGSSGAFAGAADAARVAARKFPPVQRLAKEKGHSRANVAEAGLEANVLVDPSAERLEFEEPLHVTDLVEHHLEHEFAELRQGPPAEVSV